MLIARIDIPRNIHSNKVIYYRTLTSTGEEIFYPALCYEYNVGSKPLYNRVVLCMTMKIVKKVIENFMPL